MADIDIFAKQEIDEKLIIMLNVALSSEWIAYIQYSLGASIINGIKTDEIKAQMLEHADDEKEHATILINRIVELGGKPITDINNLVNNKYAPYAEPDKNGYSIDILTQNLDSEKQAVKLYTKIIEYVKEKDPITYDLILEILQDEKEHVEDFIDILDELN